jgi:hypothetical protein
MRADELSGRLHFRMLWLAQSICSFLLVVLFRSSITVFYPIQGLSIFTGWRFG